ncbi:membrane-bound alkaline phosphatase-like isoform X1 [Pectinophora gossypiella]|uniref:membrane-bound alkaline phosphatase-like isoform X1 n=1 Tax=Pectinophora gossypiella TaxID=13191 RepID=UPI00214EC4C4|nr:membrane-bound alkaline phosphatase-like isoform X1 [Pectinophora gossypiella]
MGTVRLFLLLVLVMVATTRGDRYHPEKNAQNSQQLQRNPDAFNTAERTPEFWKNSAKAGIETRLKDIRNDKLARNVIMFLGDGMSIPTLMAARTLKGQRQNRTGEETELFFETFPSVGLSKTYCLDKQIPDSACTATAYLAGIKNNYETVGVDGRVQRGDCLASADKSTHLDSIAAWALDDGRDAGIVTTTRVTHASPSGTYARSAHRDWESDANVTQAGFTTDVCPDIAMQLITTSPGNKFKVILGGGRREFIPNTFTDEEGRTGHREDGRNLIEEWKNYKTSRGVSNEYVWNRSQLMSLRNSPPEYLLGLFKSSHLPYNLQADKATDPTLAELTEVAINSLSRNEKGYFLFVEGGRTDHAHHDNWAQMALDETLEFDLAIEKAVEMVGDDTLIVVTADHAHVMAINGYTKRGGDILGPSDDLGGDNVPYMTLSYTNGPGARPHVDGNRVDVTKEDFMDLEWRSHADVFLEWETHGGDDVAVMAWGPHHHLFTGVYEQSHIPFRMAYAACIGPGLHADACSSASLLHPLSLLYAIVLAALYHTAQW